MPKNLVLASILALAVAMPAAAAPAPTGVRIEGRGGFERITLSARYNDGLEQWSGRSSENGISYGGEIGYDLAASDNVSFGPYVGLDFSDTEYCSEVYGLDRACLSAGRSVTAGLRIAAPVSDNVTIYAKGGYANGRLKFRYDDFENILEDYRIVANRGGFHAGLGTEIALARNVYAKAEYVYTNYKVERFVDGEESGTLDGRRQQLVVGMGLRF